MGHDVFPSTIDKLEECDYFLAMMLNSYHDPKGLRFNLNAFIQALRNVTFMLQSEDEKSEGFAAWYEKKQDEMRQNPLLCNFVEARNIVVKREMLETKSHCFLGLYRGRRMKLAIGGEVPPLVDTAYYLERAKEFLIGFMLDEEHSDIGEQAGVGRKWIVEAIGPDEVVGHCAEALQAIRQVVSEAMAMAGGELDPTVELPDIEQFTVLLESDLDPTLPEKWGWVD